MSKYGIRDGSISFIESQPDYVIGADIASKDSNDFSGYSITCSNCKHLIHNEIFSGSKLSAIEIPKICPKCGVELRSYKIL